MGNPHDLSRAILQRAAKSEATQPIKVIAFNADRADVGRLNLADISLREAAEHLVVVEAHDHDDLQGVNVVAIPAGQEKHPLYEAAEVRRRSRING